MATLQELLGQSVSQAMGLGDIIARREKEALQMGQLQQQLAQIQAESLINVAKIKSQGELFKAESGGALGGFISGIETGLEKKRVSSEAIRKQFIEETQGNLNIAKVQDIYNKGQQDLIKKQVESEEKNEKVIADLRQEALRNPVLQSTMEVNQSLSRVLSAWEDYTNKSPDERRGFSKQALDQALITGFNKMLDPGSVVREGEYARTPEGIALVNRFQGMIQKITSGGVEMTDQDRETLVNTAKLIAKGQTSRATDFIKFYEKEAGLRGVKDITRITGLFKPSNLSFNTTNVFKRSLINKNESAVQSAPLTKKPKYRELD